MMAKKKDKLTDPFNEADRVKDIIDSVPMSQAAREEIRKTLTPTMIQFLLRWETGRDLEIEERVIGIVMKKMQEIYLADNDRLCQNVAGIVGEQLAEVLKPWNVRLGGIEKALEGVAAWQKAVNDLHVKMDERLDVLEERVFKTDHERLTALERYASPKNTIFRIVIALIVGVALGVSVLLFSIDKKLNDIQKRINDHIEMTK